MKRKKFGRWTVLGISLHVLVGGLLEAAYRFEAAETVYKRGLDYARRKGSLQFEDFFLGAIANTYAYRANTDKAVELLKARVQNNPQWAAGYYDLAKVYALSNQRTLAIQYYEKSLQLETDEKTKARIREKLDLLRR